MACGVCGADEGTIPGDGTGKRSGVLGPVKRVWGSEDGVRGVVGPPRGVVGPDIRLPSATLVSPSLKTNT